MEYEIEKPVGEDGERGNYAEECVEREAVGKDKGGGGGEYTRRGRFW